MYLHNPWYFTVRPTARQVLKHIRYGAKMSQGFSSNMQTRTHLGVIDHFSPAQSGSSIICHPSCISAISRDTVKCEWRQPDQWWQPLMPSSLDSYIAIWLFDFTANCSLLNIFSRWIWIKQTTRHHYSCQSGLPACSYIAFWPSCILDTGLPSGGAWPIADIFGSDMYQNKAIIQIQISVHTTYVLAVQLATHLPRRVYSYDKLDIQAWYSSISAESRKNVSKLDINPSLHWESQQTWSVRKKASFQHN